MGGGGRGESPLAGGRGAGRRWGGGGSGGRAPSSPSPAGSATKGSALWVGRGRGSSPSSASKGDDLALRTRGRLSLPSAASFRVCLRITSRRIFSLRRVSPLWAPAPRADLKLPPLPPPPPLRT